MTDNQRDAVLNLRAKDDGATRTFAQVAAAVAELRKQLDAQTKAADAGEGTLKDYKAALKAVNDATDALRSIKSTVTLYDNQTAAVERATAAVTRATKAYDDYQKKLDGKTPTDKQSETLATRAAAVESTTATLNKRTNELNKSQAALEAVGISTTETGKALEQYNGLLKENAQNLVTARSNIDLYEIGALKAADAAKQLADKEAFLAKAAFSGLTTEEIDSVTDFGTALRELTDIEEREAQVAQRLTQADTLRRQALISAAKEVASGNPILEEQFALLEKLSAEEEKASGLARLAADSKAAADDLGRFSSTSDAAGASISRLGDAIRQTIAPAVSSVQTLDGALAQVEKSTADAGNIQKLRATEVQDSINKLAQAQGALTRQADSISAFKNQSAVLQSLKADLAEAAIEVERLANALTRPGADTNALTKELNAANATLENTGRQVQAAATKLVTLDDALKRVGIDSNAIDADFDRLALGAQRSKLAIDRLQTSVGGGGRGFLGLKGYELQNLSFQVNDIVSSFAAGIPVQQIFAQQGGQVFQIFQTEIGTALLKIKQFLPELAAAAVAVGLLAEAVHRANTETEALRDFGNLFKLAGQQATYSATQFASVQRQLEDIGVSAKDAKETLTTFFNDGLNPANLQTFLFVSQKLADTLGISLPEAGKLFGSALSGGTNQLEAFQAQTHLLNDEQLAQIENFLRLGDVTSAHNLLMQAAYERTKALVDVQTPLSDSLGTVKASFFEFEDVLGNFLKTSGLIQGALRVIAGAVRFLADSFNDAVHPLNTFLHPLTTLTHDYNDIIGNKAPVLPGVNVPLTSNGRINPLAPTGSANGPQTTKTSAALEQQIGDLNAAAKATKKLSDAQSVLQAQDDAVAKAVKANADAQLPPLDKLAIARLRAAAGAAEQAKIDEQNATKAKAAESAADKAARAAEARQNKIIELTKSLQDLFAKTAPETANNPFAKINAEAKEATTNATVLFDKLGKLGVKTIDVDGKQVGLTDLLAQIEARKEIQTQQEKLTEAETSFNQQLDLRKQKLAAIEDAVSTGAISATQGIAEAKAVIDDTTTSIGKIGQQALEAAEKLQQLSPSPEGAKLVQTILKGLQQITQVANAAELKDATTKFLSDDQKQLDAAVSARDEAVRAQNALQTAGVQSAQTTQDNIRKIYAATTPEILKQVDALQAAYDAALANGTISQTVYDGELAKLQLVTAQTKILSQAQVALQQAATEAITSGFGTFIDTIGQSLSNAINGSENLKDVLHDLGNAALSFAATFAKAIAEAIIKLEALKIAQAAIGLFGGGGGGGVGLVNGGTFVDASAFHTGGVAGDRTAFSRRVPLEVFSRAVRYHTGGFAGFAPGEVPAVLQEGERIQTAQQQRDAASRTGAGAGTNIKIVNTINPGEFVSQGASTTPGQKAILNVLQANQTAARQALGL